MLEVWGWGFVAETYLAGARAKAGTDYNQSINQLINQSISRYASPGIAVPEVQGAFE